MYKQTFLNPWVFFASTLMLTVAGTSCKTLRRSSSASTLASTNQTVYPFSLASYGYTLILSSSIPETITPRSTLDEIARASEDRSAIQAKLLSELKWSMMPLAARVLVLPLNASKDNVQELAILAAKKFIERTAHFLATVKTRAKYRIMLVPQLSKAMEFETELRSLGGDQPAPAQKNRPHFYSADRLKLINAINSPREEYQIVDQAISADVYKAMGFLLHDYHQTRPDVPFFVGLVMDIDLYPNNAQSMASIQTIIGLPSRGLTIPFEKENDQIAFHTIAFPDVSKRVSAVPNASEFPCAFVEVRIPITAPEQVLTHINFGPIGRFDNGKFFWPKDVAMRDLAPKLRGTPKISGRSISPAELDFNIFNLTIDPRTLSVQNLNLFIQIGLKGQGYKGGMFNVATVNQQFENEINKAIQEQLAQQRVELGKKIEAASIDGLGLLSGQDIEKLLSSIFTSTTEARP